MDKIVIAEGTNVTLSGGVELRLRESLGIDTSFVLDDDKLLIYAKGVPKINVYGRFIEVTNASETETLKAQKRGASTVEITSREPVKLGRVPLSISMNDSRIATVKV